MYGKNTAELRDELGALMHRTRRQPDLEDLSPEAATLIQSYRTSITTWCRQAVRASNPDSMLGGTTSRSRGPAEELRYRLNTAASEHATPLPTLDQLATPQGHPTVELWRRAAKAAALGEHDFPAGLRYGTLTEPQAMTVLKDAAEIIRAVVGLDRRHSANVPGWVPLPDGENLGRAAAVCATHAGYPEPDYTVDRLGWRPPIKLAQGPSLPRLGGVLQAENNLLVHLRHQPDAYSLRLIFDSQAIVSHHASHLAGQAGVAELAERWTERAETYRMLVDRSRNLRGLIGTRAAADDGTHATTRIQDLRPSAPIDRRQLRHLDALFTHIDRRLTSIVRNGASDRSYLLRIQLPHIDLAAPGPVKKPAVRHIPLDAPTRSRLLIAVDRHLSRPTPTAPVRPAAAAANRAAFVNSIPYRRPQEGTIHHEHGI